MTFTLSFSYRRAVLGWAGACAILATAAVPAYATTKTLAGDQYIETQVPSCGSNVCEFKFNQVPDGKTLLVTRVTCGLKFDSSDAKLYNSYLGQKVGLTRAPFSFLIPVITASFASTRYVEINSEVFHPYTATQTPQIFLRSDAKFINVTCSIAGLLTVPRLP